MTVCVCEIGKYRILRTWALSGPRYRVYREVPSRYADQFVMMSISCSFPTEGDARGWLTEYRRRQRDG